MRGASNRATTRDLVRHEGGATAVEFGLLAVPFLALILFCLQVTIIYFAEQGLQSFCEDISRNILTGNTQKLNLDKSSFKTQVCAKLPALYSCSKLYLDVQSVAAFANASTSAPSLTYDGAGNVSNAWQYNPGAPGSVVVVRVMYLWPVVGTLLGQGLGNQINSNRLLMATSVFKNEQY